MPDPYKILKIRRNATDETIRKAYRKLAAKHHPDHNIGDDEAKGRFKAVYDAYKLLSDPARRAHFDTTGETGWQKPDETSHVMGVLLPLLQVILAEMEGKGLSLKTQDVMHHMRTNLAGGLMKGTAEKMRAVKRKEFLEAGLSRFSVEDGENFFEETLQAGIRERTAAIESIDQEIEKLKMAQDYLKKCKYRTDCFTHLGAGATTTSFQFRLFPMGGTQ